MSPTILRLSLQGFLLTRLAPTTQTRLLADLWKALNSTVPSASSHHKDSSMPHKLTSCAAQVFLGLSALVALADQVIKWLVQQSMAYGQSIEITPFFNWVHLWNKGAAFSLFADSGGWQRYFLLR